jgi:O-antigen ligase
MQSSSYWYSRSLDIAARISFALTIILAPLRWRITVWARPTLPLYGDYTDFLLYASDIAAIFMFTFWACSLLLAPRTVSFGSAWIWIPLAGLTIAGFVSTLGSEDYVLSRYHSLRLAGFFLFYLFIVNEIGNPAWVIVPAALQVVLQSAVGIGQSLLQRSLGLEALGELALDPAARGVSVVASGGLRLLRAYGLADHPNILGGCLAFGLVILLAAVLYGGQRWRWWAVPPFLPGFAALAMTFSRSAWVALLIGGSFMVGMEAVLRRRDSVRRAASVVLAAVLLALPFIWMNARFFGVRFNGGGSFEQATSERQSLGERMLLIRAGNVIFVEHSAIGIGLGASPLAMKNRFADFPVNYQPPHYTLLAAAMETGVFGAAFYLLLMFLPWIVFFARWRTFAAQPLMMGASALLLALTVAGFFDYYTWLNQAGRIWQWLGWGLWSAAYSKAVAHE